MLTVFSPLSRLTPEEYARVTEITYLGQVYGTMAALRRMCPRDHGTIVQVGSALAYRAIPLQSAYCGAERWRARLCRYAPHGAAGRRPGPRRPVMGGLEEALIHRGRSTPDPHQCFGRHLDIGTCRAGVRDEPD